MLEQAVAAGGAMGSRVAHAFSRRRLTVLGCAAGVAIVLALAMGRTSLPSLIAHGWHSLTPGQSHHRTPPSVPARSATTRASDGTSARTVPSLSTQGPSRRGHAATGVSKTPGSRSDVGISGRTEPKTRPAVPASPTTPAGSPTPSAPPATPPSGGGGSTPSGDSSSNDGSSSPSTPSASVDADGGSVGGSVDTGSGTSASANVPLPSDPTQPSTPTVTTSSTTTPEVTTPVSTLPSTTVPGL
jgi:hypothetical protein